jgi:hypothetical protein
VAAPSQLHAPVPGGAHRGLVVGGAGGPAAKIPWPGACDANRSTRKQLAADNKVRLRHLLAAGQRPGWEFPEQQWRGYSVKIALGARQISGGFKRASRIVRLAAAMWRGLAPRPETVGNARRSFRSAQECLTTEAVEKYQPTGVPGAAGEGNWDEAHCFEITELAPASPGGWNSSCRISCAVADWHGELYHVHFGRARRRLTPCRAMRFRRACSVQRCEAERERADRTAGRAGRRACTCPAGRAAQISSPAQGSKPNQLVPLGHSLVCA